MRRSFVVGTAYILVVLLISQEAAVAAALPSSYVPPRPASADLLRLDFPQSVAAVESRFEGTGPAILLIQDAHTNPSAQLNVARTLDHIFEKSKVRQVFLEAGRGDLSLAALKKDSNPAARERVGLGYLNKGLLQGPEYASLISSRDFELWGVENRALYTHALRLYRAAADRRESAQREILKYRQTADVLSEKILRPALLALLKEQDLYLSGDLALTDYAAALERSGLSIAGGLYLPPKIKSLKNLQEKERSIDFESASRQFRELGAQDGSAFAAMMPKRLSGDAGEAEAAALAAVRQRLSQMPDTSQASYDALRQFLEYRQECEVLLGAGFLEEFDAWQRSVLQRLAESADEKRMLTAMGQIRDWSSLVSMKATPAVFERHKRMAERGAYGPAEVAAFFNRRILYLGGPRERVLFRDRALESAIREAARFYQIAEMRDEAMLQNALARMRSTSRRSAVLVAGGFHAEHLKALFQRRGISYLSIIPRVTHETDLQRYERLLLARAPRAAAAAASARGLNLPQVRSGGPLTEAELLREVRAASGQVAPASKQQSDNFKKWLFGRLAPDQQGKKYRAAYANLNQPKIKSGARLAVSTSEKNRVVDEIAGWLKSDTVSAASQVPRLRRAVVESESYENVGSGAVTLLSLQPERFYDLLPESLRPSGKPWRVYYLSSAAGAVNAFTSIVVIYGDTSAYEAIRADGQLEYMAADAKTHKTALQTLRNLPLYAQAAENVRLGTTPYSGAAAHIVAGPGADKRAVLQDWASALGTVEILGRHLAVAPGQSLTAEDMDHVLLTAVTSYLEAMSVKAEAVKQTGRRKKGPAAKPKKRTRPTNEEALIEKFNAWFESKTPGPIPHVVPFVPALGLSAKYGGIQRSRQSIGIGTAAAAVAFLRHPLFRDVYFKGENGGVKTDKVPQVRVGFVGDDKIDSVISSLLDGHESVATSGIVFEFMMDGSQAVTSSGNGLPISDLRQILSLRSRGESLSENSLHSINPALDIKEILPKQPIREALPGYDAVNMLVVAKTPRTFDEDMAEAFGGEVLIEARPYALTEGAKRILHENGVAFIPYSTINIALAMFGAEELRRWFEGPAYLRMSVLRLQSLIVAATIAHLYEAIEEMPRMADGSGKPDFSQLLTWVREANNRQSKRSQELRRLVYPQEGEPLLQVTTELDEMIHNQIDSRLREMRENAVNRGEDFDHDLAVAILVFDQAYGETFMTPETQIERLITRLEAREYDPTEQVGVIYRISKLPIPALTQEQIGRIVRGLSRRLDPQTEPSLEGVPASVAQSKPYRLDPDSVYYRVRAEAARALGVYKTDESIRTLVSAFTNPLEADPLVREWIVDSLSRLDADFESLIEEDLKAAETRTHDFYQSHPALKAPSPDFKLPDLDEEEPPVITSLVQNADVPQANIQDELIELANLEFGLGAMLRFEKRWAEAERHFTLSIYHRILSESEGGVLPINTQRNIASTYAEMASEAEENGLPDEHARFIRLAKDAMLQLLMPDEMGKNASKFMFEAGTPHHRKNLAKYFEICGLPHEKSVPLAGQMEDILKSLRHDETSVSESTRTRVPISPQLDRREREVFHAYFKLRGMAADYGINHAYLRLLLLSMSDTYEGSSLLSRRIRRFLRTSLGLGDLSSDPPIIVGESASEDTLEGRLRIRAEERFYQALSAALDSSGEVRQSSDFLSSNDWEWAAVLERGDKSRSVPVVVRPVDASDLARAPETMKNAIAAHLELDPKRGKMLIVEAPSEKNAILGALILDFDELQPAMMPGAKQKKLLVGLMLTGNNDKTGERSKDIIRTLMGTVAAVGLMTGADEAIYQEVLEDNIDTLGGKDRATLFKSMRVMNQGKFSQEWSLDAKYFETLLAEQADEIRFRAADYGARLAVSLHSDQGTREYQEDQVGHWEIRLKDGTKLGDLLLAVDGHGTRRAQEDLDRNGAKPDSLGKIAADFLFDFIHNHFEELMTDPKQTYDAQYAFEEAIRQAQEATLAHPEIFNLAGAMVAAAFLDSKVQKDTRRVTVAVVGDSTVAALDTINQKPVERITKEFNLSNDVERQRVMSLRNPMFDHLPAEDSGHSHSLNVYLNGKSLGLGDEPARYRTQISVSLGDNLLYYNLHEPWTDKWWLDANAPVAVFTDGVKRDLAMKALADPSWDARRLVEEAVADNKKRSLEHSGGKTESSDNTSTVILRPEGARLAEGYLDQLFGRPIAERVVLEVGVGDGAITRDDAAAHPETDYIGIDPELSVPEGQSLQNIRWIRSDSRRLIPRMDPESVDEIRMAFPNPAYLHPEHTALADDRDVEQLISLLKPGGRFVVVTENSDYAQGLQSLAALKKNIQLSIDRVLASEIQAKTGFSVANTRLMGSHDFLDTFKNNPFVKNDLFSILFYQKPLSQKGSEPAASPDAARLAAALEPETVQTEYLPLFRSVKWENILTESHELKYDANYFEGFRDFEDVLLNSGDYAGIIPTVIYVAARVWAKDLHLPEDAVTLPDRTRMENPRLFSDVFDSHVVFPIRQAIAEKNRGFRTEWVRPGELNKIARALKLSAESAQAAADALKGWTLEMGPISMDSPQARMNSYAEEIRKLAEELSENNKPAYLRAVDDEIGSLIDGLELYYLLLKQPGSAEEIKENVRVARVRLNTARGLIARYIGFSKKLSGARLAVIDQVEPVRFENGLSVGLRSSREDHSARAQVVTLKEGAFDLDFTFWSRRNYEPFTEAENKIFDHPEKLTPLKSFEDASDVVSIRQSLYDRTGGQVELRLIVRTQDGRNHYVRLTGADTSALNAFKEKFQPNFSDLASPGAAAQVSFGNLGDLPGNVAWVRDAERGWRFVAASDEAWTGRLYRALVNYEDGRRALGVIRMEEESGGGRIRLFFRAEGAAEETILDSRNVRFVLSACALGWGDEPAQKLLAEAYTRSSDLRHVFSLPMVRPGVFALYTALTSSDSLLAAALRQEAVDLPLENDASGASPSEIIAAMTATGYQEAVKADALEPGQFIVRNNRVLVKLLPGFYPVNTLVVSRDGRKAAFVSVQGVSGREGAVYDRVMDWVRRDLGLEWAYAVIALDNGMDPTVKLFDPEQFLTQGRVHVNAALSAVPLSVSNSALPPAVSSEPGLKVVFEKTDSEPSESLKDLYFYYFEKKFIRSKGFRDWIRKEFSLGPKEPARIRVALEWNVGEGNNAIVSRMTARSETGGAEVEKVYALKVLDAFSPFFMGYGGIENQAESTKKYLNDPEFLKYFSPILHHAVYGISQEWTSRLRGWGLDLEEDSGLDTDLDSGKEIIFYVNSWVDGTTVDESVARIGREDVEDPAKREHFERLMSRVVSDLVRAWQAGDGGMFDMEMDDIMIRSGDGGTVMIDGHDGLTQMSSVDLFESLWYLTTNLQERFGSDLGGLEWTTADLCRWIASGMTPKKSARLLRRIRSGLLKKPHHTLRVNSGPSQGQLADDIGRFLNPEGARLAEAEISRRGQTTIGSAQIWKDQPLYLRTELIRLNPLVKKDPRYQLRLSLRSKTGSLGWVLPGDILQTASIEPDDAVRAQMITRVVLQFLRNQLRHSKNPENKFRIMTLKKPELLKTLILRRVGVNYDERFLAAELHALSASAVRILEAPDEDVIVSPAMDRQLRLFAADIRWDLDSYDGADIPSRDHNRLRLFFNLYNHAERFRDVWVRGVKELYGLPESREGDVYLPEGGRDLLLALDRFVLTYTGSLPEGASRPVSPWKRQESSGALKKEEVLPFVGEVLQAQPAVFAQSGEEPEFGIESFPGLNLNLPLRQAEGGAVEVRFWGRWERVPSGRDLQAAVNLGQKPKDSGILPEHQHQIMRAASFRLDFAKSQVKMDKPQAVVVHLDAFLGSGDERDLWDARLRSLAASLQRLSKDTTLVILGSVPGQVEVLKSLLRGIKCPLAETVPQGMNHVHLLDRDTLRQLRAQDKMDAGFRAIVIGDPDPEPGRHAVYVDGPAVEMAEIAGRIDLETDEWGVDMLHQFFKRVSNHEISREDFVRWILGDEDVTSRYPLPPVLRADLANALRLQQMAARLAEQSA